MAGKFFSPRQVARAIDVSESSLKRWCDRGLLPSVRTAGGHRRLPVSGVIEFLRGGEHQIVRPELLGLPPNTGNGPRVVDRARRQLIEALVNGDGEATRRMVLDLHLAEMSIAAIGDEVIAPAMEEIGRRWECRELEVFRERRACELLLRSLFELESMLPAPADDAPRAIGGTLAGDSYQIPTTLAAMVLQQNGWRATSLGASLPVDTLLSALVELRPRLFWLSVSHIDDVERFLEGYGVLYTAASQQGIAVVVGGYALTPDLRRQIRFTAFGDTMQHLEAVAGTLAKPTGTAPWDSPQSESATHKADDGNGTNMTALH